MTRPVPSNIKAKPKLQKLYCTDLSKTRSALNKIANYVLEDKLSTRKATTLNQIIGNIKDILKIQTNELLIDRLEALENELLSKGDI